ncbi:hypothetical protein EDD85DRAFT_938663 [Armillaria nabsnona]|nr:hypothetical protein EDD85DRAFT_938663 [Armillaria nabsnona]
MTAKALAMASYSPPDIPSDVDVRVPKPVVTSGHRIVVLSTASKVSRVYAGGGIEGDGDDRGDDDDEVTMYLVSNPTSSVKRQVFESGIEPSSATARRPLSNCPITSPWHRFWLEELNSAATFPSEAIHSLIQVEKRVMNERRSHLPSLGLLHTMRRKFNFQRTFYSLRHHVNCSVDSPRPEPPDKATLQVCPGSGADGRVKSSAKKLLSFDSSTHKAQIWQSVRTALLFQFDYHHHLPPFTKEV